MPSRGPARQIVSIFFHFMYFSAKISSKDRDCLVCGEATHIAHLGINLCRACAVFYRRAKLSHDFVCRTTTGSCPPGKGFNCKRCRYDHIVSLLERAGVLNTSDVSEESAHSNISSCSSEKTERPFLERVKTHYKAMSLHRHNSELNSRPNPPHPLEVSLEKGPFYPADFASMTSSVRILMSAALDFGANAFPDFARLEAAEKWELAMNFFYLFRMFEACYRTSKIFTREDKKYFVSYSTYFTVPFDKNFFNTAPQGADLQGVYQHMVSMTSGDQLPLLHHHVDLFTRLNLSEEEFITVAVLMFWTTSDLNVSEEIHQLGERIRGDILKELYAFYREEMGLVDYAVRLGELMMVMQMFEKKEEMKEHYETLRLYNIMKDDNFIYRLQKDLKIE
ncbi:hypothetical protein PMAYCL1PPCAC_17115 [Pristionchus mayeri]|uniref:Nuclear receptor n=1 Tax=Pristionchus mayeri TaxID=1317129 RepID=A0AAN5I046_9BILA|nr:hypothetical protein PMAYCL1PPCAC_17115 [Pristionchus mayeri]